MEFKDFIKTMSLITSTNCLDHAISSPANISIILSKTSTTGIVYEPLQNKLVDHICSSVENEMEQGKNFIGAYQEVLKSFGNTSVFAVSSN